MFVYPKWNLSLKLLCTLAMHLLHINVLILSLQMYLMKHQIEWNWRNVDIKAPPRLKVLKGHDDHVVGSSYTCNSMFNKACQQDKTCVHTCIFVFTSVATCTVYCVYNPLPMLGLKAKYVHVCTVISIQRILFLCTRSHVCSSVTTR